MFFNDIMKHSWSQTKTTSVNKRDSLSLDCMFGRSLVLNMSLQMFDVLICDRGATLQKTPWTFTFLYLLDHSERLETDVLLWKCWCMRYSVSRELAFSLKATLTYFITLICAAEMQKCYLCLLESCLITLYLFSRVRSCRQRDSSPVADRI